MLIWDFYDGYSIFRLADIFSANACLIPITDTISDQLTICVTFVKHSIQFGLLALANEY